MSAFEGRQLPHEKTVMRKSSFSLWHLAHICGCPFQKVSHDLIELCGILGGDDGNACTFLDRLPCDSRSLTALAGNRYVL